MNQGIRTLECEILHFEAFMRAALATNHRGIRDKRIVDAWVWHQVRLELGQVHVQGTIKPQAGGDGAHHLGNQTVQVLEAGTWDIQVAATDVVNSLVVDQKGAV